MHEYLSLDIIFSSKITVLLENCSLLGTNCVRGQISVHICDPPWDLGYFGVDTRTTRSHGYNTTRLAC